jgi:hypothetical protein
MPHKFRAASGHTFSRESLHRALDSHKAAQLIKRWRQRPLEDPAPVQPGERRWQWEVTMCNGDPLYLYTPYELHAFVCGLASARDAFERSLVMAALRRPQ